VWRTTTEDEPALTRPLSRDEYQWRVDRVHAPYHQKLRSILDAKIARFGYVILLCGHSMPSVGRAGHIDSGVRRADVVPGTRGRTSCHVRVIAAIEQVATDHDLTLEHDRPYKGGYTTAHYGRPSARVHAIQIELARRLYLDETKLQRLPGAMEATQALCRDFVAALAELTAADLA
jgi:N-formylglutamate amidohydrolase